MKKIVSLALVCVLLLGCVFALASCGNISESYAEKVNQAAKDGEAYTIEQIRDDLGEEAVEILFLNNGVVVAVDGCKSIDDIKAKIDEGKTVKGILITVLAGKATAAVYKEITEEDLK